MVGYTAKKAYFQIDDAIALWAKCHAYPVAHTWPSLIEHRDSLSVAHDYRPPGRVAWRTGTRQRWTDSVTPM